MPFPFVLICDLLTQLEKQHHASAKSKSPPSHHAVLARWFSHHRALLDHPDTDVPALFSTLLPEKRTDRVYGIQEPTLHKIIGRAFCLGISRLTELKRYEQPGSGVDFAECVAKVLIQTPNPMYNANQPVTNEEVDAILHGLASACRFSSPAVRSSRLTSKPLSHDGLGHFYGRLSYLEALWFTRLVLKSYGVVSLNPQLVYKHYDPRLPVILQIQDNFDTALQSLRQLRNAQPLGLGNVLKQVKPALGTKVGRQDWLKGRSIKNCVDMSPSRISCEKKIDGEYCQIHVDLNKTGNCIQIFSKSGKDSTRDRVALHRCIRDSLNIGREAQAISQGCILEGEMVVYNDRERRIMPFDVIRKHVSRSGVFIGVERDSPPDPEEHLMIVFFDILLVDNESLLSLRQTDRFNRLKKLITCREGHAELVERQIIDLDQHLGASHLRRAFAKSIRGREEGLVLKPDEPYFDIGNSDRKFSCRPIKLKKEYIGCFGDVGDFAVVGARYDAAAAKTYAITGLKWTHFFLGCLTNKEVVLSRQAKPHFAIINSVELNETQLRAFMLYSNPVSVAVEDNSAFDILIPRRISSTKGPSVMFPNPPVLDIRCFSFSKQGNTGFHTPRFPQVSKVHYDRDFMETTTFEELQSIARKATSLAVPEDSQETLDWIAALEAADPRGRAVDAVSQLTASSGITLSPRTPSTRHSQPSSLPLATSPTICKSVLRPGRGSHSNSQPPPSTSPALSEPATHKIPPEKAHKLLPVPRGKQTSPKKFSSKRPPPSTPTASTTTRRRRLDTSNTAKSQSIALQTTGTMAASATGTNSLPDPTGLAALVPTTNAGICTYLGRHCSVSNRDVILSPCIQNYAFVIDNLLPAHGITQWATDPRQWAQNAQTGVSIQESTPEPEFVPAQAAQFQHRRQPKARVCFIERAREEVSRAFLARISNLNLRRPDGSRDWVEVYDWRVLELILQNERAFREGEAPVSDYINNTMRFFCGLT